MGKLVKFRSKLLSILTLKRLRKWLYVRRKYKEVLMQVLNEIDTEKVAKAARDCWGFWGQSKVSKRRAEEIIKRYLELVKEDLGL